MQAKEFAFDEQLQADVFGRNAQLLYNTVHLIHFGQSVDYKMLAKLPVNEIEPMQPLQLSTNQILQYVP